MITKKKDYRNIMYIDKFHFQYYKRSSQKLYIDTLICFIVIVFPVPYQFTWMIDVKYLSDRVLSDTFQFVHIPLKTSLMIFILRSFTSIFRIYFQFDLKNFHTFITGFFFVLFFLSPYGLFFFFSLVYYFTIGV